MTHTMVRWTRDPARRFVAGLLVALLAAVTLVAVSAASAQAAARLSASSSLGGATASAAGATTFTVSGSGFDARQTFGGVYVGFGWVDGAGWGPSRGGATGRTYDYLPDDQSKNNKGYQAFVAFPGSETAGEAQGTMSKDGSFRIQLTVPGPSFTGAGGKRIDCLEMTCGFFTWGAHGVRSGANETFTPVTFQGGAAPAAEQGQAPSQAPVSSQAQAAAGRATSGRPSQSGGRPAGRAAEAVPVQAQGASAPGDSADAAPAGSGPVEAPEGAAPVAATGGVTVSSAAVIEVDRKSARPGGAMGFAAAGFWPGEQVYVVLGDGLAAVGPVLAGVDGEVAGVMVLPEDLEAGTHEIRAAGAGSAIEAVERFPVRVDIAPAAASTGLQGSMRWIFLTLAALALLAAGALYVRRRHAAADGPEGEFTGSGDASAPTPQFPTQFGEDQR